MKKTLKFVSPSEIGIKFDSLYNNFIEHRYYLFSHLLPKSLSHLPRLLSYSLPQRACSWPPQPDQGLIFQALKATPTFPS